MGLLNLQQQQLLLNQQHQNNLMGVSDIAQPFPVYAAADVDQMYQGGQEEYDDEEQVEGEVDGQDCMEGQQQELKVADSNDPVRNDGYGQEMLINDLEQNQQQQKGHSETYSEAQSAEAAAAAARQNL